MRTPLSKVVLLSAVLGLGLASPAGAQASVHAVAGARTAVVAIDQTSTTTTDDETTTTAAPAEQDDSGTSLRGPWTAVSAVAAVTILLIVARRRLRAGERDG